MKTLNPKYRTCLYLLYTGLHAGVGNRSRRVCGWGGCPRALMALPRAVAITGCPSGGREGAGCSLRSGPGHNPMGGAAKL